MAFNVEMSRTGQSTAVAIRVRKLIVQVDGGPENHGEVKQCCQYKLYTGLLASCCEDATTSI